jgi:hypothetical protein
VNRRCSSSSTSDGSSLLPGQGPREFLQAEVFLRNRLEQTRPADSRATRLGDPYPWTSFFSFRLALRGAVLLRCLRSGDPESRSGVRRPLRRRKNHARGASRNRRNASPFRRAHRRAQNRTGLLCLRHTLARGGDRRFERRSSFGRNVHSEKGPHHAGSASPLARISSPAPSCLLSSRHRSANLGISPSSPTPSPSGCSTSRSFRSRFAPSRGGWGRSRPELVALCPTPKLGFTRFGP